MIFCFCDLVLARLSQLSHDFLQPCPFGSEEPSNLTVPECVRVGMLWVPIILLCFNMWSDQSGVASVHILELTT